MRCLETAIATSFSACLAPYQKLRRSISPMGISMIEAALACGLSVTLMSVSLDRRRRVLPAEPVARGDREQVQQHDARQEEQRRREGQRPRRAHGLGPGAA